MGCITTVIAVFGTGFVADFASVNDMTMEEIYQTFFGEVLIASTSYIFSMWRFIYLGLIGCTIY
ncbi:MAG: hypothetical protein ACTMUB_02920 [cyanobacterium endosymbiont of Rhopalodia musculus]|uniref:hypothetical protein n=1 Tax=cyanobacterium endosymbiont of Epithemia clementina EcSB TaxID=3034674 RepID=UPI00247FEC98|nr:hypothetical protein [cyanobacterium endosymbiont of Epithemia clementina EcSB]WGT67167.1 hypothetical protein P3F56_08080 [cyanobacterium endosymbiont of Epithemia clementina EcSB]